MALSSLFIVVSTLNMRPTLLTHFEVHNSVLLTIRTLVRNKPLEFNHQSFNLMPVNGNFPFPSQHLPLTSALLCSELDSCRYFMLVESCSTCPSVTGLFLLA